MRFKWGSGLRIDSRGYVQVMMPQHHRANSSGYVFEHILVAEKALGKALPLNVCVHHADGNRANNKRNLVICQDNSYHLLIERRTRAYRACGHANWIKCRHCKQYDNPDNDMYVNQKDGTAHHRSCEAEYAKKRRAKKGVRTQGTPQDGVDLGGQET